MARRYTAAEEAKIVAAFRSGKSWTDVKERFDVRGQSTMQRLYNAAHGKPKPGRSRRAARKHVTLVALDGPAGAKKSTKSQSRKCAATPHRAEWARHLLAYLLETSEVTPRGKRLLQAALEMLA